MKKLALLFAGLLFAHVAFSQQHLIGFRAGPALTNAAFANADLGTQGFKYEMRLAFTSALTYDYLIRGNFSLGADLMYQPGGFWTTFPVISPTVSPVYPPLESEFVLRNHMHYLALPLKIGVHSRGNTRIFGQAALVPSFLLTANAVFPNGQPIPGQVLPPGKTSIKKYLHTFDLAARLEVGVSQHLGSSRWQAFSSISAQRSMTNYLILFDPNGEKARHYLFFLNLGVQYLLSK